MKSSMLHNGEEALWVTAQYLWVLGSRLLVRRHIVNTHVLGLSVLAATREVLSMPCTAAAGQKSRGEGGLVTVTSWFASAGTRGRA